MTAPTARDEHFMRLALAEAERGRGRTSPNPVVGAVLVRGGEVVGRGHHSRAGSPHAEVEALADAEAHGADAARGADLYSTLEPCNHQGKTPPCTEAIIRAGIARVIVGCSDANPLVAGRGIARLREAGVPLILGCLESECRALNAPFFKFITRHRPYVTLKLAATLDGKIATSSGDSRWVTGEAARRRVHELRSRVDAVLVGAGTVRADDPRLTARGQDGAELPRQPLRVVLTRSGTIPPDAAIYQGKGEPFLHPGPPGLLLDELARRDVMHLLVEGGAEVAGAFLEEGLVDELLLFLAPRLLGPGLSMAALGPRDRMDEALRLGETTLERVGEDWLLRAELTKRP